MDPNSSTSNTTLVERELRRRISEVERERDSFKQQVEIVRSQADKFRRLLLEAETKNLQEKLAYLDLENKYERERMMRMNIVGWCTVFRAKTHWVDFETGKDNKWSCPESGLGIFNVFETQGDYRYHCDRRRPNG